MNDVISIPLNSATIKKNDNNNNLNSIPYLSFQTNKRKRNADNAFHTENYIYGIVTTATNWYYLKFDNDTEQRKFLAQKKYQTLELDFAALEDDSKLKDGLKEVIGTIVWLLKDKVGDNRLYKKNKAN